VLGGTIVGMLTRVWLPEGYLNSDAKDAIKLALGLIATMVSLVLGLLISTAKASYDSRWTQLTQIAADAKLIDGSLALYGSDAKDARDALRDLLVSFIDQLQFVPGDHSVHTLAVIQTGTKNFYSQVRRLLPHDEEQKSLKAEAVNASFEMARIRAVALSQRRNSIPTPFLVILVFWLVVLFAGFGLFAPVNRATVVALGIGSFCVAAAIFLILQMDQPFTGLMRVSIQPLRDAAASIDT
jgi:hypothetical protein